MDQMSNVGDGSLRVSQRLSEQGFGGVWVASHELARGRERQRLAGKLRSQAIVQITAETPPLLFASQYHPLMRLP